jgi:hypothetical protein
MHRLVLPALLALFLPLVAAAQAATPADTNHFVHISPAVGVHYGTPLRLSVAAGGLFDFNGGRNDGVIAMGEMGQSGGQVSVGYFRSLRFGQGYDLRAAVLRTSDDPWKAAENATYVGVEGHLMLLVGVGGRAGWFRRVTAVSGSKTYDNVGMFGVSIGF